MELTINQTLQQGIDKHKEGVALATQFTGNRILSNILGDIYSELGQYEVVITNLNKAIKLKSVYRGAYNNRGKAFKELVSAGKVIVSHKPVIKFTKQGSWFGPTLIKHETS